MNMIDTDQGTAIVAATVTDGIRKTLPKWTGAEGYLLLQENESTHYIGQIFNFTTHLINYAYIIHVTIVMYS